MQRSDLGRKWLPLLLKGRKHFHRQNKVKVIETLPINHATILFESNWIDFDDNMKSLLPTFQNMDSDKKIKQCKDDRNSVNTSPKFSFAFEMSVDIKQCSKIASSHCRNLKSLDYSGAKTFRSSTFC